MTSAIELKSRTIAVVPCYNTSHRCAEVIRRAMDHVDAVLAVDDGSSDDTLENIRSTGCLWLKAEHNEGKGRALRRAFEAILKPETGPVTKQYEYVVTLDGDGQHDPAEIPKLLAHAGSGSFDLVVGTRNIAKMPPKSKIGALFSRALFQLGLASSFPDTQSGFRVVRTGALRAVFDKIVWRRYETEMDILCRILADGFQISAIPIQTIYFERNRRSHFRPFVDSMRVIFVLLRYAVVSLMVSAIDVVCYAAIVAVNPAIYLVANIWSRLAAMAFHFLLSRRFVFLRRKHFNFVEGARYVFVVVVNLIATIYLISVSVGHLGTGPVTAKVLVQTAIFFGTFLLMKVFVFPATTARKTDWNEYHRRPFPASRLTHRVMAKELTKYVESHLDGRKNPSVLGIGGGNSCFLPSLLERFPIRRYTIIDNCQLGIDLAEQRYGSVYGERVVAIAANIFDQPACGKFDLVYSVGLLEHFETPQIRKLIQIHSSYLKRDALLMISVPTPTVLYRVTRFFAEFCGKWKFPDEVPVRKQELLRLLEDCGLRVLRSKIVWGQILTQLLVACVAANPETATGSSERSRSK